MGMTGGNSNNAAAPTPAPPLWQKLLKSGLQGTSQGLQNYGQQQQMIQQPQRNKMFYGA